jgi:protein gp37
MTASTKIEWCDSTWSAWIGCTKVSTAEHGGGACDNCYAEGLNKRFHKGENWGLGAPRRELADANWRIPYSWHRNSLSFELKHGRRRSVFLNNQSDIFDNEVDDGLRARALQVVEETTNLLWLMLTKRIGNAKRMLPARWLEPGGWPKHVRLGITACNQPEIDRDVGKLLELGCPNFLSLEPLLGAVDLTKPRAFGLHGFGRHERGVDWVIVGGESGPRARPMHPQWARDIRDQCEAAGVAFFMKQMGGYPNKRAQMEQFPQELRVQEFPV